MKNFVNFLKENWTFVAFVVMFIASVVLISRSELLLVQHIVFWVFLALSCVTLVSTLVSDDDRKYNAAWLTTGIYFLAISVIWYLPIAIYWSLIPIFAISLIHLKLTDCKGISTGYFGSVIVTFSIFVSMKMNIEVVEKQEFIANTLPEPVVITYVDKTSKDNIKVFIEGKGIFLFDNSDETEDAWKLSNGDTVQIVVYQDKISKLIY